MDMPLRGRIALVAGATRGAGRGISVALGELGATVYCTGRTSNSTPLTQRSRPETIEETAALVTAAGGRGIAVVVDHSDPTQIDSLVAKIRDEQGRLDLLVNDIWGGESLVEWGKPFWELSSEQGFAMFAQAVHTHIQTTRSAMPLLFESSGGLIVEITDGDALYYRGNLFYDLVKTTVMRLAFAMSEELADRGVAAIAVTPGFLRSEAMLEHFGVTPATWRDAAATDPNFAHSETPLLVGRGIARMAADPSILALSGKTVASWTLAHRYDLVDADGSRPDWGAYAASQDFGAAQAASHARFANP